ncbi:MAG: transglutaminase family protein [Rubrivivax sp.]|nr:transglutaminase family protein [Rubrivivax sp.]
MTTLLEVTHTTRYRYAVPVSPALHLAHLQPLADAHQALLDFDLGVDPAPDELSTETDVWGNVRSLFAVVAAHRELVVRATSRVALQPRFAGLQPAEGPAWEAVARRLQYVARSPWEPAVEFVQPSPFVPRLEVLRSYARSSFPKGRPVAEAALDLMHRIHADFRYDGTATQIDTPLAQAFAQRSGVCQDFAHVLAGCLRMLGLPARYVSGYLLTTPAGGEPAFVGADASHAWVQAWVPGTPGVPADGWLDLDPTNDLVPHTGHVRVAVGRDFGDVTPLRGVIRGGGRHTLTVGVHTRTLDKNTGVGPGIAQGIDKSGADKDPQGQEMLR